MYPTTNFVLEMPAQTMPDIVFVSIVFGLIVLTSAIIFWELFDETLAGVVVALVVTAAGTATLVGVINRINDIETDVQPVREWAEMSSLDLTDKEINAIAEDRYGKKKFVFKDDDGREVKGQWVDNEFFFTSDHRSEHRLLRKEK